MKTKKSCIECKHSSVVAIKIVTAISRSAGAFKEKVVALFCEHKEHNGLILYPEIAEKCPYFEKE